MWKTLIASGMILGLSSAGSFSDLGYDRAGKYYLQKMKKERKSVRSGSVLPRTGMRSGGIHNGK